MMIQKALAEIRELRQEELDLVGGAWSSETTLSYTFASVPVSTPHGTIYVTVVSDVAFDTNYD